MKKIFLLFLLFAFIPLAADQTFEIVDDDGYCPAGGVMILLGEDADSSEHLEGNEVTSTTHVCNGKDGCDLIVSSLGNPAPSSQCAGNNYGILITNGLDCDFDGTIDEGETELTLCYGNKGTSGSVSLEVGELTNGKNGESGKASELVVSEDEDHCKEGGTKIEIRFDANENDTFEESEVSVYYVCNGESPQGSQGEQGKQGIAGTDGKDGADGAKGERGDKGEQGDQGVAGEKGETGADGFDSLVSVVDEPAGDNCGNGGKKFMSGLDKDRNGVLDESEVRNSYYICNGEDAVEASEAAASSSGCSLTLF